MHFFGWEITKDDLSIGVNYSCALLGIGSLAMGRNMGQAGLIPGIASLLLIYVINIYAVTCLSKTMIETPKSVTTFGDLGEYIAGKNGRHVVLVTQFGGCLLIPIAFLVLGGSTLLPIILADIWPNGNPNIYIPVMAAMLLPFVLIRSLKEAAWAAILGTLGAVGGVLFAVIDSLMHSPYYANSAPKIAPVPIVSVCGSLFMAFGAGVIVPALQREHPRPERMPAILRTVITLITLIYLSIGLQGYFQYGCVAPSNLLLSMSDRNWELAAMIFFFVHIVLAYTVYVNPVLFLFERYCFNMHQMEAEKCNLETQPYATLQSDRPKSVLSQVEYRLSGLSNKPEPRMVYKPMTVSERLKSYSLRTTVVGIQVFLAMLLQGCFDDLVDFVGSSTLAISCFILPIYFYLKKFSSRVSSTERKIAYLLILIILGLALYTSYRYITIIISKASKYGIFQSPKQSEQVALDLAYCENTPEAKI